MKRRYVSKAAVAVVFVFVLTLSPYAHAADTSAFGINDPFTDAIQLWSAVLSSIESLANQIASALQLHQTLTFTAKLHAPKTLQQPAALAASAALATQSPPETATTSGSESDGATTPQQPQTTSPPKATSDQTTSSPFVKSAVSAPLASNQTTQSPFVKSPDFSPKQAVSGPLTNSAEFSPPSSAGPASAFVTQARFNAALSTLGASVQQLLAKSSPNPTPQYIGGDGNTTNPYAAVSNIGQLSNVTITNPTITGLSAGEIPDLSGSYLSLGGGTLTGAFADSGTASSSFAGALGIGTTSPSDVLAVNGPIFLGSVSPAATADRLYNNGGSLYWAGSLVGGATTGNWTTDGTNVWRTGGDVGIGTSSPFAMLSVAGTGDFDGNLSASSATIGSTLSASGTIAAGNGSAATKVSLGASNYSFSNNSGNMVFQMPGGSGVSAIFNSGGNGTAFAIGGASASIANLISITPASAGSSPTINAGGTDSVVGLNLNTKNGGSVTTNGGYSTTKSITYSGTASALNNALYWSGSSSGSCFAGGTNCALNSILVNGDSNTATTSGAITPALAINHNFGGGQGGFDGLNSIINMTSPTLNTNDTGYYVALSSTAQTTATDTGTVSAYSGHLYGIGTNVRLTAGAGYWDQLVGQENDIAAYAGSSLNDKIGLQIVELGDDAVSANRSDIGISLNNSSGATGWKIGLGFGAYSGVNPIAPSGTLIGTYAHGATAPGTGAMGTVADGIDFSNYNFTGDFLKSAGFSVDGSGDASTTQVSSYNGAYFGATATSTFGSNGALNAVGVLSAGEDATHNGIQIVPGSSSGNNPAYIAPLLTSGQSNIPLQLRASGTGGVALNNSSDGGLFFASQDGTQTSNTDNLQMHALASGSNAIYLETAGADSRVDWRFITQGASSKFAFGAGGDSPNNGNTDFEIDGGNTPTAWLTVNGSAVNSPTLGCHGTNCNIILSPNGTGNIGIGTTTPGSLLSLNGIANFATATSTFYSTGGINLAAGCFAIGGNCLGLGNISGTLAVNQGGTGSTTLSGILVGNGTSAVTTATLGGSLSLSGAALSDAWTLSGSNLYNNTGTNVGINNTSPSNALDVGGYINTGANYGYKQAGITILFASSTNALTAGGISALANYFNTTASAGETAFGYQALQNATSSTFDTAVGYQALKGSAMISTTGSNTAFGYKVLTANTSGVGNNGFGTNVLIANTTGQANNGFGNNALNANTTGTSNDAFGHFTLSSNTTGGSNNAFGRVALQLNTTGGQNSAFGENALQSNITGSSNAAFGYDTSHFNGSATNTVAIGYQAARGTAAYNAQGYTVVGDAAGLNFSTGANWNTLLGYAAGNLITTGADNIVIGGASTTANSNLTTGSQNILVGQNISLPSATLNGQLDIGNLIYGTGLGSTGSSVSTGDIGIGTTTPYARLTVWGPDTSAGTSAFVIANSASTTEFNVLDNGNATLAGTLTQNSDQRLKTNIQSLDASSSLALIDALNPVTFNWIDLSQGSTTQLGFIAQQLQQIFPNLVATTSPTALTPDGTLSVNYIGLISPIVSAIQALSAELNSIENTITGFAQSITTHQLNTDNLCVGSTCVTPTQFQAMLAAANQSGSSQTPPPSSSNGAAASSSADSSATPPVLQVNGDDPAIIQVGATYTDLGATIEGPQADLNLGITTYVNGSPMNPVQLDTTTAATDTIQYVATDSAGLTATTTRTVIIEPAVPSLVPTDDASTTTTTATSSAL